MLVKSHVGGCWVCCLVGLVVFLGVPLRSKKLGGKAKGDKYEDMRSPGHLGVNGQKNFNRQRGRKKIWALRVRT